MAIYHFSAKLISRKAGRSATAAAAYRAAERIVDESTGEVHDYTKKRGVEHAEIVLPSGVDWTPDRAGLWNAVEAKNKRADAQVAREFVVALPDELTPEARKGVAVQFAREIADTYRVAADVTIHAPSRDGDNRNHHAHILTSTNRVEGLGFGNKARELDLVAHNMGGKVGQANEIDRLRQRWAELVNERLRENGIDASVDHRSLEAQGIDRAPTQHMGPAVAGMVRRGAPCEVARRMAEEANARLYAARELGRIERELDRSILDLSGDLTRAKAERASQQQAEQVKQQEAAREFARQAVAQFKAEQAARDFAKNAAEQFKADMAAKEKAEQARRQAAERELVRQKQEAEAKRQAELERQQPKKERDNDGPSWSR